MAGAVGQLVPVPGGVLIEDADGFTVGAVGISGDTSEKDEYRAIGAVQDAGLRAERSQIDPNCRALTFPITKNNYFSGRA